jgi:hypothetical protein
MSAGIFFCFNLRTSEQKDRHIGFARIANCKHPNK